MSEIDQSKSPSTRISSWVLLLAVAWFLLFSCSLARQTPRGDETEFWQCAVSVLKTGLPTCYASPDAPVRPGLWHPPTYIYSMAASLATFGIGFVQARLPGILAVLLTAWALMTFARDAGSNSALDARQSRLLGAIFLLCPLTCHYATLLDIDGTMLTCVTTATLLLLARVHIQSAGRLGCLLGCALAICFLVKTTTSLLLLPAIAISVWRQRGYRDSVICTGLAAVVGMAGLFCGMAAFSAATGMSPEMPISHNVGSLQGSQSDVKGVGGLSGLPYKLVYKVWMAKNAVLWLSPFLLLLAVPASLEIVRRGTGSEFAAVFFCWGTLLGYSFIQVTSYGFPKYAAPALPWLVWLAFRTVLWTIDGCRRASRPDLALGVAVSLTAAFAVSFGDPFLVVLKDSRSAMWDVVRGLAMHYALPCAAGALFVLVCSRFSRLAAPYWVLLFLIAAWAGTSVSLLAHQAGADYYTSYRYGDVGLEEVAARARPLLRPGDVPLVPRDVGLWLGHDYWPATPMVYAQRGTALLGDPRTTVLVYRPGELDDPARVPEFAPLLQKYFQTPTRIGTLMLVGRKPRP